MGFDNPLHIIFLLIVLLLVFGAKRLPEIGRSLGSGMREFKQSISGEAQHQQAPQHQQTLSAGPQPVDPAAAAAGQAQQAAHRASPPPVG